MTVRLVRPQLVRQSHSEVTFQEGGTPIFQGSTPGETIMVVNSLRLDDCPAVQLIIEESAAATWLKSLRRVQLDGESFEVVQTKDYEPGFVVMRIIRKVNKPPAEP